MGFTGAPAIFACVVIIIFPAYGIEMSGVDIDAIRAHDGIRVIERSLIHYDSLEDDGFDLSSHGSVVFSGHAIANGGREICCYVVSADCALCSPEFALSVRREAVKGGFEGAFGVNQSGYSWNPPEVSNRESNLGSRISWSIWLTKFSENKKVGTLQGNCCFRSLFGGGGGIVGGFISTFQGAPLIIADHASDDSGNRDKDRRRGRYGYVDFIPSSTSFLIGTCLIGSGLFFGIFYLARADKSPWKIIACALSLLVGGYLVAHGTAVFLDTISATFDRRSENVLVKAVIIAELELSDIEREICGKSDSDRLTPRRVNGVDIDAQEVDLDVAGC